MHQALWLLLETLGSLLAGACLLRAYMNFCGTGTRNPVGQFVMAFTDWLVSPLRRMLGSRGRVDWSSLLAALIVSVALAFVFALLFGSSTHLPSLGAVLLIALYWLLKWALWLITILVIAQAVLSWVNPHAPMMPVVDSLTRPVLAPIRRLIPLVGGVDLSPLVLILLLQVLLSLLQTGLLPALLAA